jgi:hypothetical protein
MALYVNSISWVKVRGKEWLPVRWFTSHPEEQDLTYAQHRQFAHRVGLHLLESGLWFMVHGVFPFIEIPRPYDLKSTKDFIICRWIAGAPP